MRILRRAPEPAWRRQWRREGFRQLVPAAAAAVKFPEGRTDDNFRWGYDETVWLRPGALR